MFLLGLNVKMANIMNICIICADLYAYVTSNGGISLGGSQKFFHGKLISVMMAVTRRVVFSMNCFHELGLDFVVEVRVVRVTFRGGKLPGPQR